MAAHSNPSLPLLRSLPHPCTGCGHGGTRKSSTSRNVQTCSVSPAAMAGVRGCHSWAEPVPCVGTGCGTYLHTTHHSSIVRICYHHNPFFGQTGEIIRWLRRQPSESLVIKLQDGLELAIPAWMLDPLACSLV